MLSLDDVKPSVDVEDEGREVIINGKDGLPWMIKDADGNDVRPATMRIRGTYSRAFTKTQNRILERNRRRPKQATEEQNDQDNYEQWAACVISWELMKGGKQADPKWVFENFPFILAQVSSEARDHVSFSETVSSN